MDPPCRPSILDRVQSHIVHPVDHPGFQMEDIAVNGEPDLGVGYYRKVAAVGIREQVAGVPMRRDLSSGREFDEKQPNHRSSVMLRDGRRAL